MIRGFSEDPAAAVRADLLVWSSTLAARAELVERRHDLRVAHIPDAVDMVVKVCGRRGKAATYQPSWMYLSPDETYSAEAVEALDSLHAWYCRLLLACLPESRLDVFEAPEGSAAVDHHAWAVKAPYHASVFITNPILTGVRFRLSGQKRQRIERFAAAQATSLRISLASRPGGFPSGLEERLLVAAPSTGKRRGRWWNR